MRSFLIFGLGLAATGLAAAASLDGQPAPVAVITDTPEYCEHMIARVEAGPHLTPEMQRLLGEARRLCDQGQIRGGIMRLRRALLLIRDQAAAPQP